MIILLLLFVNLSHGYLVQDIIEKETNTLHYYSDLAKISTTPDQKLISKNAIIDKKNRIKSLMLTINKDMKPKILVNKPDHKFSSTILLCKKLRIMEKKLIQHYTLLIVQKRLPDQLESLLIDFRNRSQFKLYPKIKKCARYSRPTRSTIRTDAAFFR
ncbi:hypothetical protein OAB57_02950 [Bacteriovoracaceae bacterium]|nr:hypothetical protein [Bacteriovoracaceae bacterium]